jgi:hypothetical protein
MSAGIAYCGSAVLGGQLLVVRLFIDKHLTYELLPGHSAACKKAAGNNDSRRI